MCSYNSFASQEVWIKHAGFSGDWKAEFLKWVENEESLEKLLERKRLRRGVGEGLLNCENCEAENIMITVTRASNSNIIQFDDVWDSIANFLMR